MSRWVPLILSMGLLKPPVSLLWNKCRFTKRENGSWLVGRLDVQVRGMPGRLTGSRGASWALAW